MQPMPKPEPLRCGLRASVPDADIPLRGVRIEALVSGTCSRVTVTQRYENTSAVPIEATYVFPLESGSAVCGFQARLGDRLVEGRVEEREKAFELYDDAMADGHGAMLLDQERPNIFTASVGNLAPGQTAQISITYVALLNLEGEAVRLMLPTTVSPRYVPASSAPEIGEPDGDRVNPERRASVPYGLTLQVDIAPGSPLASVESPSHAVRTELLADGGARVTLSQAEAALDRDFVLLVTPREPHRPQVRVAREADGTRVVLVSFVPSVEQLSVGRVGSELHFVIDCSGSMSGDSIDQARRALALCLRALGEGDTFNIVAFGSEFRTLWTEPRPYSQATLDEATRWLEQVDADMGGTEILAPLQAIVARPVDSTRPRQVLLLTDGEVSNDLAVLSLCATHAATTRVFSFGIGAGVSEVLVRGVAQVSGGAAEFIYPGERIEAKVLRMFRRVPQPTLREAHVDWGGLAVEQAPAQVPAVFAGEPLVVMARIKGGHATQVTLRAGSDPTAQSWTVPLDLEQAEGADSPVPVLWARQRIQDLETGAATLRYGSNQQRGRADAADSENPLTRLQAALLELARRYGLMSSVTSFVAVESRAEHEKTAEQAVLRKIPVALTAGWGGHGTVLQQSTRTGGVPRRRPAAAPAPKGAPPPPPSPAPAAYDGGFRECQAVAAPAAPAEPARKRSLVDRLLGRAKEGFAAPPAAEPMPSASPAGLADAKFAYDASDDDVQLHAEDAPDVLYELLLTQRADGSFALSAGLLQRLGDRADAARAQAARHGESVVATALVLRWLEDHQAARRDEWLAAATKARAWLARQAASFDAAAEPWFD